MAINRADRYPGRWETESADYPLGKPKNRTSETSKDGTYPEKDWISDYEAFFGALMTEAGYTANATVDTSQNSQFFDALSEKINGTISTGSDGYQIFPSGLIVQWGSTAAGNPSADITESLPIEFPNAFLNLSLTSRYVVGSGTLAYAAGSQISKSQFTFRASANNGFDYLAIGY